MIQAIVVGSPWVGGHAEYVSWRLVLSPRGGGAI